MIKNGIQDSAAFTDKGPRKGWRTPLNIINDSEQRDEEKEGSRGPFASERGDEPRSGMPIGSTYLYTYFGARYMDHELMTMWLSVDPMADKYPSISPYAYCAWNPMKLVDPDGREIDVSALYDKSGKCKFKLIEKALMAFAKTKYGYKELSKYAKAGQEILGVKFDSDGEYHKKKMDLSFGGKPSKHYYNGDTDREIINCRLKIAINLSNVTDIKSIFETICHELFIHARQIAKDYDDNGVLDHSYLVPYLKKYVNDQGRTNGAYIHAEHAHFAWYDTEGQFLFIKTIGTQYPHMSNKEIIKMINEGFGNSSIKVKR